ncbi:MAG: hypothetical protein ACRDHE_06325 [Ktedonobacterales bacterium]
MARWRIAGALLAGLLLTLALAACNDAPANHPQSQHPGSGNFTTVHVTLTDTAIKTDYIDFVSAQPPQPAVSGPSRKDSTYHFVVQNTGTKPHEFLIAPPLSAIQGQSVAMDRSIALVDKQNIASGATVTFDITFSKPSSISLEFASHEGNDYQNGMHVGITVV